MSHVTFGLPEYHAAKPKDFGNLHERMHFVKGRKEDLRLLLEQGIEGEEINRAAHRLFVAIMDLETEVAQYQTDRRPRSSRK